MLLHQPLDKEGQDEPCNIQDLQAFCFIAEELIWKSELKDLTPILQAISFDHHYEGDMNLIYDKLIRLIYEN